MLGFFGFIGVVFVWFTRPRISWGLSPRYMISQYTCAVLLIVSSIALVAYQVVVIDDVSNGLLVYVAQAFLLVGSIFGLDYYVKLITRRLKKDGEYGKISG